MSYLRPKLKHLIAASAALVLLGLGSAPVIKAETMRSDSFIIQFGNFNITSGRKSGGGYTLTDTVGQIAPGEFSSTGFTVYSGFQYIYAIPRFSFRIIDLDIDLGLLSSVLFNSATNQLVISTRSGGYSILTAADHPLRLAGGSSAPAIDHTDCDTGCSITSAGVWVDPQNNGFGFNVEGDNAAVDFVDSTHFRPFADREDSQSPQVIASHNALVKDDVLTITYKATVDGFQEAGVYQTSIDYIAVPTY